MGGGHSHAIVLRQLGMQPLEGVRLTLITNLVDTPYSGMLPCHISGLYSFDDSHIDLRPLANFAGCQLVMDEVIALNPEQRVLKCANHPDISYDVLSINVGSTPTTVDIPGAAEWTIPAKPVPKLLQAWGDLLKDIRQHPQDPIELAIVGGGVAGVELILNMQARILRLLEELGRPPEQLTFHLVHRGADVANGRNRWTRQHLRQLMQKRRIQLHLNESVVEVKASPEGARHHCQLISDSGLTLSCDRVFWVTNASAPKWLQGSGLALDPDGFIAVADTLQSQSHPTVFAAGDVATMVNHPRPKAGVFAVRQGPPLFENLRRILRDQTPKPFFPQTQSLNIIDTGTGTAIASRGPFGFESVWARRWKHWIDGNFMALFSEFPKMSHRSRLADSTETPMICAGCGSKVGSRVLSKVLNRIRQDLPELVSQPDPDVVIGLHSPDDAAVVKVAADKWMVHTVDFFEGIVTDPFLVGQITAHHCLNDILAMGAQPQTALAIVVLPSALPAKLEETLYHVLLGSVKAFSPTKTTLVGGHTTEGSSLSLGFACNGVVDPDQVWTKGGLQPGHDLILTKALGTGTLFAADRQLKAKGRWIAEAITSMMISNAPSIACFHQHQVTACTDISGFGLVGHLLEMIQSSQVSVELDIETIPIFEGARETLHQRILSSLHAQNHQVAAAIQNRDHFAHHPHWPILFDPQTSGGLLVSLPSENTERCLAALRILGYDHSCRIGRVLDPQEDPIILHG